jgi:RNA polymerase sigma-70 factor (ECF subfamily)
MDSIEHSFAIAPNHNWDATANWDAAAREEALVEAAKAGSHIAFAELQRVYSSRLYKRILSITRNHEDAEDALQDALIRAYRGLPSFEGRSKLSSWLTRIAINSALMTMRKRRSRPEIPLDLPLGLEEDGSSFDVRDSALNPEQYCDQKQRCEGLRRAIHRLEPALRTTMIIRMAKEKSTGEIAHELDLTVAAAKSRLYRARKRLTRFHPAQVSKRG